MATGVYCCCDSMTSPRWRHYEAVLRKGADRFRLKTTAVMAIVHWRGSIAVMLKRKCMNFVLRNAGVLLNEMSKLSPRNEGFVLNVLHCFPSALPVPES